MQLESREYEDARQSRDPRFDGCFFIGVLTTGIYCRSVCSAKVPKLENIQLYKSAASAASAGFRPCLRCCPESSPGTTAWSGSSWKVSRALQLIDQGYLDANSAHDLALQLEVGSRQLSRLFQKHLGASPINFAQTRRLHLAKKLIDETLMPLAEICFAAGFGSVRRFNAVFNDTYGRSPKELRGKSRKYITGSASGINITLAYRLPYDWKSLLGFLAYRAIPGVELVSDDSYARSISLEGMSGYFIARFLPEKNQLAATIQFPDTKYLYQIIDRIRSIFDLRADSAQIDKFLKKDKMLCPLLKKYPGLRVPGSWDGFEVSVRAVLGQQVTVKAASTLASRIAQRYGSEFDCEIDGINRVFPEPAVLARAKMNNMGIVSQRIAAIKSIAELIEGNELIINCTADTAEFVEKICQVKGIGEWTAQYIAMRALSDPNAFPYSDLILLRAADPSGKSLTPKQLLKLAEAWRPWRAYTVILLWKHYQMTLIPNSKARAVDRNKK